MDKQFVNALSLVALLFFGVIALGYFIQFVQYAAKRYFPCKSNGPLCHKLSVATKENLECGTCGAKWKLAGKLYSIASDGDPDSYISQWERVK